MSDDDSFDEQSSNDGNNSELDLEEEEEEEEENSSDPDEMELDLPTTSKSNEERSFECNDCGRKFSLLSSLESHINSWHTDEQSKKGKKCPICKKIITPSYFDQHVRDTHSDEKPFKCEECGMSFKRKSTLAQHIKDKHTTVNLVECQVCHKSYPKKYIKEHMQAHNDEKSYNCSECGKSFNTKSGVYNHKLHVHRIGYDAEKLKRKCPICDKVLANQASLSGHMKTHEGLRPHKCTECNQNFATKSSLKEHVSRLHNAEENKCTCDQCGKVLKGKTNLKRHMRIHSSVDELPTFECDICHKRFRQKPNLVSHQRIHRREEHYFCQYCDQSFVVRSSWVKHERQVHTEKPEQCNICQKIFASHLALLSHTKFGHNEEMSCNCTVCSKWLKARNNDNDHVMSDHESTSDSRSDQDEEEDCDATQQESAEIIEWRECSVIVTRLHPEIEREALKGGGCRTFNNSVHVPI